MRIQYLAQSVVPKYQPKVKLKQLNSPITNNLFTESCPNVTGLTVMDAGDKLPPTVPIPSQISFGYKSLLKTYFLEGKLPTVVQDIYGSKLTKKNCTLEHIIPHSKKQGRTILANLALAAGENNWKRGDKPLSTVFDPEAFKEYCEQFKDIKLPYFNGNEYIKQLTNTVNKALKNGW